MRGRVARIGHPYLSTHPCPHPPRVPPRDTPDRRAHLGRRHKAQVGMLKGCAYPSLEGAAPLGPYLGQSRCTWYWTPCPVQRTPLLTAAGSPLRLP